MNIRIRVALAPLTASLAVILVGGAHGQTTLVDEDFQTPLLNNGTSVTTEFTGWTMTSGSKTRREDNQGDAPGDSTVGFPNQVIQLEGDNTVLEYDISHNWTATDVYHLRVEVSPMSWNGQNQRYIRPDLRQQDGTVLWSTAQDATTAMPLYDNFGSLADYTSDLTYFFDIDASTFSTGTAGQPLRLRIDSTGTRGVYINNVKLVLGPLPADNTPPAPDPLTWDIVPTVSNFKDISMRAGSARDPGDLYGVEYYFENTVRGTNSGWQDSREWSETDLDFNTLYTYRVKARDKSPNQNESTTWSTSESATTEPEDLTPPPAPTWSTPPEVADYRSLTMAVNAVSDPSGVEYNFKNVTNTTESGWQDSPAWTQKDLDPDTSYTYEVIARDKALAQNEGPASAQQSATTPAEPAGTLYITRFQDPLIGDNTAAPDLGNWVFGGGTAASIKIQKATGDGVRTDTDLSTPSDNRVVQFEWAERFMTYDLDHNWSATDTFTLTIAATPQSWSGTNQRYIRPSIREQNGTVLWEPGENLTGPEKTAVTLYPDIVGSSYQDDSTLTFTYTIPASAFTTGTEGEPIALRIKGSGQRGLFVDNVHLSVGAASGAPEIAVEQPAATDIPSGGSKDFGAATIGTDNDLVFTILNTGDADLNLTGAPDLVAITGDPDFSVTVQPSTNPVPMTSGSTTFTVRFNPQAAGARSATISIDNDDSDENPFTISLTGTGEAPATPFQTWATGGETWTGDGNGDGVADGLAFLLGAADPSTDATGLLPTFSESGGNLVMTFSMRNAANRGTASLATQHSSDLGETDAFDAAGNEEIVPEGPGTGIAVGVVSFDVTANGILNDVVATIPGSEANGGSVLFGRVEGTE